MQIADGKGAGRAGGTAKVERTGTAGRAGGRARNEAEPKSCVPVWTFVVLGSLVRILDVVFPSSPSRLSCSSFLSYLPFPPDVPFLPFLPLRPFLPFQPCPHCQPFGSCNSKDSPEP